VPKIIRVIKKSISAGYGRGVKQKPGVISSAGR
jgi:hypothetical protein